MTTIIVSQNTFYSHFPKRIPKGTVKAETVSLQLDKSWEGLTVFSHWRNLGTGVEKRILLEDPAHPCSIPWEVLADLGELRMGLVGMDGGETVKPTIWLTYGYVVDGVDPDAGEDPQQPTPSWQQQMVEQATQASQAAQEAQEYAKQAAESIESAGPYAEEAKQSAEDAKASEEAAQGAADTATQQAAKAQETVDTIGNAVEQAQKAATDAGAAKSAAETAQGAAAQSAGTAQTAATTASQAAQTAQGAATQAGQYLASVEADAQAAATAATAAGESKEAAQGAAQTAANARDQANTAATTAQDHATAADAAKTAAEQAAGNAATAQDGAARSAQDAAGSASAAQLAKEGAEAAASVLPTPTPEDAGKAVVVNPEGDGYVFGDDWSGGAAGSKQLVAEYIHRGNKELHFTSIDWESGVCQCTEPHGLSGATEIMIVQDNWNTDFVTWGDRFVPIEWCNYQNKLYAIPNGDDVVILVGSDKLTPVSVNPSSTPNKNIDATKFHFEVCVDYRITNLDLSSRSICVELYGVFKPFTNRTNAVMYTATNGFDVSVGPGQMPDVNGSRHFVIGYERNDYYLNRPTPSLVFTSIYSGFSSGGAAGYKKEMDIYANTSLKDMSNPISEIRTWGYSRICNGGYIRIYNLEA